MTLNATETVTSIQRRIHLMAKEKGWYESQRTPLEMHMLMVSELAEATEEARRGTPPVYAFDHEGCPAQIDLLRSESFRMSDGTPIKPEGELIELADCVIRIMDYCESRGWDLDSAILRKIEFNATRPHRHGGKKF